MDPLSFGRMHAAATEEQLQTEIRTYLLGAVSPNCTYLRDTSSSEPVTLLTLLFNLVSLTAGGGAPHVESQHVTAHRLNLFVRPHIRTHTRARAYVHRKSITPSCLPADAGIGRRGGARMPGATGPRGSGHSVALTSLTRAPSYTADHR